MPSQHAPSRRVPAADSAVAQAAPAKGAGATFPAGAYAKRGGRLRPGEPHLTGKVIVQEEAADILREFAPFEKVEGLGIAGGCDLWAALDHDGGEVEPRLVRVTG